MFCHAGDSLCVGIESLTVMRMKTGWWVRIASGLVGVCGRLLAVGEHRSPSDRDSGVAAGAGPGQRGAPRGGSEALEQGRGAGGCWPEGCACGVLVARALVGNPVSSSSQMTLHPGELLLCWIVLAVNVVFGRGGC